MKIKYSPTYSILKECPREYVEYLSKELVHFIDEATLSLFSPNCLTLAATKKYLFKATKNNNNTWDVFLYSGFISRLLTDIWDDNTVISRSDLEIVSTIPKYIPHSLSLSSILRPHQKQIVTSCLQFKRGIVKSPTSSGKSFCIGELVKIFTQDHLKVLITVPTINLLYQMTHDINDYFSLSHSPLINIGIVGDGHYIFNDVTVGIPNSLSNLSKSKSYLNSVDVLLTDECHLTCNPTFQSLIEHLTNRRISLAFSATPDIVGPHSLFLEAFFGSRICTISELDLIQQNIIMQPKFYFYTSPKGFLPTSLQKNAANISTLSDSHRYKILPLVYNNLIINNSGRNHIIVTKAIEEVNKKQGPIIIIVNKVKGDGNHADIISSLLSQHGLNFPIISGYLSKKKRELIIQDLKDSKINGVIAGPKVLTAGINIPSLSSIILAAAGKSSNDFIQRVGRLLRKKDGKQFPTVIDFIDTQFWFKNQSQNRIQIATTIYGKENINLL